MTTEKIIEALLNELKTYGVRWLNGKDLGSTSRGSNHANMAVDFSETRLEVVSKEGDFDIIFGNRKSDYNRLMANPILKPFVYVNDGIRIGFAVRYKEAGKFGSYAIGKDKRNGFGQVTNYTIEQANQCTTSSSINGDCGWKSSEDKTIVERNKIIITFFLNQFKENDFYKDWECTPEKIREGLSKINSI